MNADRDGLTQMRECGVHHCDRTGNADHIQPLRGRYYDVTGGNGLDRICCSIP
ncbi:MAG: hypothetical protein A4E57_03652 [Syntrophorhabdaceae bacterium PtaU1.Bin034]|nr:MAG: hypothetical protein A4E57_03652 [Syntrophorhabdaceae bacterium PtaU1.Bin034]